MIDYCRKGIKIVLTEDHNLMRSALASLLKQEPAFEVIAEAGNGKELIEILKRKETDIVLLDIEMPVMNGKEALNIIKKRFPGVRVIILSMYDDVANISEFMANGANAYLPKGFDDYILFEAIYMVYREGFYYHKETSAAMLRALKHEKQIRPFFDELALTEREVIVLKELCNGRTNKEISFDLRLSVYTVDFHRTNIYKKTKSKNLADLVKYSIRNGIISL